MDISNNGVHLRSVPISFPLPRWSMTHRGGAGEGDSWQVHGTTQTLDMKIRAPQTRLLCEVGCVYYFFKQIQQQELSA